jgi:hypothetical protein
MTEAMILEILMRYVQELGYSLRLIENDIPRIYFDAKIITIKREDLIVYHVLHELAHILLGPSDTTRRSIAKHELLAEGISIVVRDVLGFEPHPKDAHYLKSWLAKLRTSREKFYKQHTDEIARYAKVIAQRIRRERGTSVPFKGRQRVLATSGEFVGSTGQSNYRSGVRLCHALPGRIQRHGCTTTEGHGTPECVLQSAHHLA